MQLATFQKENTCILYDAGRFCDEGSSRQAPGLDVQGASATEGETTPLPLEPRWFCPDYWREQDAVTGEAPGRGASLFLKAPDRANEQWVLRPYRRGGLIARLNDASYLWTGLERTRAFRELRLTAALYTQGLPVPRPVAAGVWQRGLVYRAALITVRLAGARALADCLADADAALLERVGATIRRFHHAGLDHVDLNARNLLIAPDGAVFLIDLDRCRLRHAGRWQADNLSRLERSLEKFDANASMSAILDGYHAKTDD
ncbi:3-deoxy-D-manno-octulosonic acid kinase [Halomonas salinarum]|uniref:3-deoxy-D-manno-octulosonic acid kinase n=1 Tax=Halomonas salinarum TaxID=1158993 RepID=UPI00143C575D|nr:3-deoxy-D-manno-octulosonic acid kinase [Halomonas salinarum]